mmetsp:Transcript_26909/g.52994  ORF Transcript_26909/g.52994 Transcript_26909/m.52994 type:complete len:406 (+) Transcript_26909:189-1406(+)
MKKIAQVCKERKDHYSTPTLNDNLHLSFGGYRRLGGLEQFSHLRGLWLENNNLSAIENIDHLVNLRCLYLGNNVITKISGLENLSRLNVLSIHHNLLESIEGLSGCTSLETLEVANNNINDISLLSECPTLVTVDVKVNKVESDAVDVLARMPNLRALYLKENPCVKKVIPYRKTLIGRCRSLCFIDDRPVLELERVCAEAWIEGGKDEEKKQREQWMENHKAAEAKNMQDWKELRSARREEVFSAKSPEMGEETGTNDDNDDSNLNDNNEDDEDRESTPITSTTVHHRPLPVSYSSWEDGEADPVRSSHGKIAWASEDANKEAAVDLAAAEVEFKEPVFAQQFEWTADLDEQLVRLCGEHFYDFEKVSTTIGTLSCALLTTDECRSRYADLESNASGGKFFLQF